MNYLEAEHWLIGGLLDNPENVERVLGKVSARDFSDPTLSKTFGALEEICKDGIPLDSSTVISSLRKVLKEDEIEAVMHLGEDISCDLSLDYWRRAVRRGSLERRLRECTHQDDVDLSRAETIIQDLAILDGDEALYHSIKEIPSPLQDSKPIIEIGFTDLDPYLKFRPGHVMVVAGRTGEGKTSFGIQTLYNMSKKRSVGMVSLEMTKEEIKERMEVSFEDLPERLFISDPYALSTLDLEVVSKALRDEQGVEVILVDYLQLMREGKYYQTRHLEVSHIIRMIKEIAKKLKIAFIVISTLNRGIENREERSLPSLADLKESGDIEYAADSILFVHTPSRADRENYENENTKLLIVAKNKFGYKVKTKILWDGAKTRFGNYRG